MSANLKLEAMAHQSMSAKRSRYARELCSISDQLVRIHQEASERHAEIARALLLFILNGEKEHAR